MFVLGTVKFLTLISNRKIFENSKLMEIFELRNSGPSYLEKSGLVH